MNDLFTVELPKNVAPQQLSDIEQEMRALSGVDEAGTLDARSIDPATIGLWVQAAAGILGVAATAVPLIEKILNMIRGRNIKGAKLRINGNEIEVDNTSPEELKAILAALGGKGAG